MKLIRGSLPLVLLAVLTACGAQTPAASPGTSLTWAIETEPITFNPHQWSQNKARLLVFNQFDALVARDANGEFIPWLAKSWRVSPDGKTYTFELRDDVTFHDGERFDAAAVKANLDKLREPGYNPTVASIQLRWLDRVEVVSPTTVKITLKRPDGLFLDFLASPYAAQVSPRSLRTAKDLKAGGPDVVGTGPFILDRYVRGQEVRYRRNPAYRWAPASAAHQGPAHLAEITYRFLPEGAVRVGALTSGQVQVIEGVPATDIASIENDPELTLQTALNSGSAFSYYFNTSRPRSTTSGYGRPSARRSTSTPCSSRSTGAPPPGRGASWPGRARSTTPPWRAPSAETPPRPTPCSTRPGGPGGTPKATA